MFERYTQEARQIIFYARFEAGNLASGYIETEHLLLALLQRSKLLWTVLPAGAADQIRKRIEAAVPKNAERIATSVDLPLAADAKCVLAYAAAEAERLAHGEINSGHLVLGLLRVESCPAAALLNEQGISVESFRQLVTESGEAPAAHGLILRTRSQHRQPHHPPPQAAAPALNPVVAHLANLVTTGADRLNDWSDKEGAQILHRKNWTRKEALGHLVDCAAAHQQWFAVALTEPRVAAHGYPTMDWLSPQNYRGFAWRDLVDLWVTLNRFLVHVIAQIPPQKLSLRCRIGIAEPITLETLVSRYVEYFEDVLGKDSNSRVNRNAAASSCLVALQPRSLTLNVIYVSILCSDLEGGLQPAWIFRSANPGSAQALRGLKVHPPKTGHLSK
jgi:hypothetical protein